MIKYENECVSCGLNCVGDRCKHSNVPYLCCDKCECEENVLYEYNGEHWCKECVLDDLQKITLENCIIDKFE